MRYCPHAAKDRNVATAAAASPWCDGTAFSSVAVIVIVAQNFSFVLLQCLLRALYLIVLSVRYLIQLGRGRFCLIFFAIRVFLRKLLIDPIFSIYF